MFLYIFSSFGNKEPIGNGFFAAVTNLFCKKNDSKRIVDCMIAFIMFLISVILMDTVRESDGSKFVFSPIIVELLKDLSMTDQPVTVKHVNCTNENEKGKFDQNAKFQY